MKIEGLKKSFNGLRVIENLSLEVKEGECVTIVGPNGCGKTTLLRIIAGLIPYDGGVVEIDKEGDPPSLRSGKINFLMQKPVLAPWLNARQNIGFPIGPKDESERKRVEDLIDMLELRKFADYFPNQLSGGMQQKVAIARGLFTKQKIFLLDEPFSSLDQRTREEMQMHFLSIIEEFKLTAVVVTHASYEAVFMGQRVAILSQRPAAVKKIVDVDLGKRIKKTRFDSSYVSKIEEVESILDS